MVEHSPKILASEEKATTTTTVYLGLNSKSRSVFISVLPLASSSIQPVLLLLKVTLP